jgi:DNA polymerase III epsilon subunit-like protein
MSSRDRSWRSALRASASWVVGMRASASNAGGRSQKRSSAGRRMTTRAAAGDTDRSASSLASASSPPIAPLYSARRFWWQRRCPTLFGMIPSVHWSLRPLVAIDLETTGLDAERDELIEWGYCRLEGGRVVATGGTLVRPSRPVGPEAQRITGLDDAQLQSAPVLDEVIDTIAAELERAEAVIAYNASFDRTFLARAFSKAGRSLPDRPWLDPFVLVQHIEGGTGRSLKLSEVCTRWNIVVERPHRAPDDAAAAAVLLLRAGDHADATTLEELLATMERALLPPGR